MAKAREFEIKDFLGIASSNRNPQKNEAQLCKNLDLREITGDLTLRKGYRRKYAVPTLTDYNFQDTPTWLRATNFVIDINGTEQEVTLLIGKAELIDLARIGNINIPLFFIYPYYNGSAWVQGWQWLNECYLTKVIPTGGVSENQLTLDTGLPTSNDYFNDWTIFNLTNYSAPEDSQYHHIYDSEYIGGTARTEVKLACDSSSVTHGFSNSDRVLLMRNFIPYADLLEYYNVTASEISFHNVLNDLRIGFGGKANRLPLMIGHRNKTFDLDTTSNGLNSGAIASAFTTLNKIILTPYNSITEDAKAGSLPSWDQNVYQIVRLITTTTDNLPDGRWFFKLTGLLDGYEEFVLPAILKSVTGTDINTEGSTASYFSTSSAALYLQFRIFWDLFNKRFTKFRLYVSYDSTTSAEEATLPYYLLKEWDLSDAGVNGSGTTIYYNFNNYGYIFHEYAPSSALDYSFKFSGTMWTNLNKYGSNELAAKLNYPITDDYVRGWDHSVVVDRTCYVINPYINGERLLNYIYFSPFSGAGASQYDALQSGNYINIDSHDGNNLKGLGVFSNANLAAFKTNTLQKIRSTTAQVADLAFGYGLDTFRSIVNHGDKLTWCSQEDILSTNGMEVRSISENTIRSLFRAISTKTNIIATKEEKENAYRFYDGVTDQYILTKRGWVNLVTYLHPADYIIAKDGTLWFMKDGNIFYHTGYFDANASDALQAISVQWKSIPFDISLIGEGLTQGDRFWVDGIFCKYSSADDLTLKIYLDGSATAFDTITLPSGSTYYDTAIKYGAIAYKVEIEVTGDLPTDSAVITPIIISSVGFRWRPIPIGNRV